MKTSVETEKLKHVHPDLCSLYISLVGEFKAQRIGFEPTLLETLRTKERQSALVASGASRTMNSRHLLHNGFCHAIDIGADVDLGDKKEVRWDWPLYYKIAEVMRSVSSRLGIPVIWGGIWDTELAKTTAGIDVEVAAYQERYRKRWFSQANGGRYPGAFIDGPHYELPWSIYP